MRVFDFNSALVRAPGRSVVDGLRAGDGPAPAFDGVRQEHAAYVAALREAGVVVTSLDPLEEFPDAMFVEDPALVFSQAAILLRPGAPSRMSEAHELRPVLAKRFDRILELSDGYADGGDILVTPREVVIGLSSRTDARGAAALRGLLDSLGLASRVVDVPRGTLHLKTGCSLVDEDTMLATAEIAASGLLAAYRVLVVPEEEGAAANALRVNDRLLLRAGSPRTRELLASLGVDVVPLAVDQVSRIDAGLSCMSLRWFDGSRAG